MCDVTQSYLDGITEGRDTLKALVANGLSRREAAQSGLDTVKRVIALKFSREMAEFNRGQRDFFANQLKRKD